MTNDLTAWLGGGVILTTIITCWGYIRGFCSRIVGYLIVSITFQELASDAIINYCNETLIESKFNSRAIKGWLLFVRPHKKVELVGMDSIGPESRLFWSDWIPIILTRITNSDKRSVDDLSSYLPIKLTFIRGTIDINKTILDAIAKYNQKFTKNESTQYNRFRINYIFGTSGKPIQLEHQMYETASATKVSLNDLIQHKFINWTLEDIGPSVNKNSLSNLALSDEAQSIVTEIDQWLNSESWYKVRNIPYKRGFCLYGPPGNGKTALVRSIGETYNLPIYVYDLYSLYNDELRREWSKMLANAPAIALFEDMDNVFIQRESKNKNLSFDSVLNCLDGVGNTDGIITFITTNHIQNLDSALCEEGKAGRPGRIDKVIKMDKPDANGKLKIAKRILEDWPATWNTIITEGRDDSGAQFERRAIAKASHLFWKDKT